MEFLKKIVNFVRSILKTYSQREGRVYSVYMAFYLIVSIFPFLVTLVAILSFVPFNVDFLQTQLLQVFPTDVQDFLLGFINSIKVGSGFALISSLAISLWSSSRAFAAITDGLDRMEQNHREKKFFFRRIFGVLEGFVFIVGLILVFSIPSILNLTRLSLKLFEARIPFFLEILQTFKYFITLGILFFFVLMMYTKLPTKKRKFKEIWIGALFTTIGWVLVSYLFNLFVSFSGNALYGALSIFVALGLWFNINSQILLYGSVLNQHINEKRELSNDQL